MNKSKYFYDKQIRRYLLQIARIFSGYQVSNGYETINGKRVKKYTTVPVAHAALNRLGSTYLNSNSENIVNNAPAMAFYISSFQPSPEYRTYQHHTKTTNFTEKAKNTAGEYVNVEGKKYSVTQVQPVPFEMKITLDIWTSSQDQKMELMEQILVYFNPGFEFRVNSSRFDMGQVSNIELEDIQWTSKGVPVGSDTNIEFATLVFKILPVYISTPAKITRQNVIKNISLGLNTTDDINTLDDIFADAPETHIYVSPNGYRLEVSKATVNGDKRHVAKLSLAEDEGFKSWPDMFREYGVAEDDSCLIRIRQSYDLEDVNNDVYAHISITDDDTIAVLDYDVDTFKANTIPPIQYIIAGTNSNQSLFDSDNGTSILVASDMTANSVWGLEIPAHTIITKDNDVWSVTFNPTNAEEDEYVLHTTTREQYKFNAESKAWEPTMVGTYAEGYWSFDIQKVLKR